MKTIQMTIDEPLLKAVDRLIRVRKTSRSALIRAVLAAELQREDIHNLEVVHTQAYMKQPVKPGEFDVWADEQDWGSS